MDEELATAAAEVWEESLQLEWTRSPVWIHGDLAPGNLLVRDGRLGAVIDFGGCGVGGPACDLTVAWTIFSGKSRLAFCAAVQLDDETWSRARGWAVWKAVIALAGAERAGTSEALLAQVILNDVIADHRGSRLKTDNGTE